MSNRVLRNLALPVLSLVSLAAHAQCAICESPLLTSAINRVTAAVNSNNVTTGNVESAVNNATTHMDNNFAALQSSFQATAKEQVVQQGLQRAVEQTTMSYDPVGACDAANRTEAAGASLSRQGSWAASLAKRTRQRVDGVVNAIDAMNRLNAQSPASFVPQFVLAPAGTLSADDLQRAHDFNMNMLSPFPPTDPVKLPDKYKSRPEAKSYDTTYKLYMANYQLYARVINRPLEMMAPSVPVTQDMIHEWEQIRGSSPISTALSGSNDPNVFPDQRMTLVPQNDGGQPKISELDYLRTEVFKRYANPHWRGEKLETMTENQLLKEIAAELAIQNRMQYEIMLSSSSMAYSNAVRAARESNAEYGSKLQNIEASMRANQ